MLDVLDEIIDKLPPSTVRLILEYDNDRQIRNTKVLNVLSEFEEIQVKHLNKQLKRKIIDIKSKTTENKSCVEKLKSELEFIKNMKKTPNEAHRVKALVSKINELEAGAKTLTKGESSIDLTSLFNEIEELNSQIEDYKKKISEAQKKYECFDGFPPDIEQGKEAIATIKQKIKQNKADEEYYNYFFSN